MADIATTVPLSRKYLAHDKPFERVDLRAPVYKDFMELGDIQQWQPGPQGGMIVVTYYEVISAYIDRLCISPGAECLSELSLEDTDKVVDAVKGFFSHRKTKSTGSPKDSSLGQDSAQETSSE